MSPSWPGCAALYSRIHARASSAGGSPPEPEPLSSPLLVSAAQPTHARHSHDARTSVDAMRATLARQHEPAMNASLTQQTLEQTGALRPLATLESRAHLGGIREPLLAI